MSAYTSRIIDDSSAEVLAYHSLIQPIPDTVDLSMGEVLMTEPPWLRSTLSRVMDTAPIGYVSPQGIPDLRQSFAHFLQSQGVSHVTEDNILVTSGAKEAIWLVFLSEIRPGDKIMLPRPGWPPYVVWARALGAEVVHYDPSTPGDIVELLRTKVPTLLVLNYPNNPTGLEITLSEMKAICTNARQYGVTIISDEVYRFFSSTPTPASVLRETDLKSDNFFFVDSVSKMLALAGLRVGFLVSRPDQTRRLTRLRASHGACVCSIAQWSVNEFLKLPQCKEWIRQRGREIATLTEEISLSLTKTGFEVESSGAMYVWIKRNIESENPSVINFPGAAVKVAPGSIFGSPDNFRICTARSRSSIEEVLNSSVEVIRTL